MWRWLKWIILSLFALLLVFVGFIVYLQDFQLKENDRDNPPRFIEADFIDLSKVNTISKYRSGIGHSTDDAVEKCRSLRHIFGFQGGEKYDTMEEKWEKIHLRPEPGDAIDIFAPVTGQVIDLSKPDNSNKEGIGQTIVIKPDNAPGFKVRIDSIFLDPDIKSFGRLKAGEKIGIMCRNCPGEIEVYYSHIFGERSVSYVQALTDKVFAAYQARGMHSRDEAVISREYRDVNPFTCENPKDRTSGIMDHPEMHDMAASFVLLSGYAPQVKNNDKESMLKK